MAEKKPSGGNQKKQNKQSSERYKKYTFQGDSITRAKNCPRCGPGIFLAVSKDRVYCGKCHYTEFSRK